MKVTGSAVLNAPRDHVWAALIDPEVLVRTIPGCRQLEQTGPDAYRATVRAGVASIKGEYSGSVTLTDQDEPSSFVMHATGAGAPGTVSADVQVKLADADGGSTRLEYDADAVVGGMIGGVGQRMLSSAARRTADQFFAAVDDVLTGVPEAAETLVEAVAEQAATPREVYTAPPSTRPAIPVSVVLSAAAVGALIAFAGVLLGWLIAR